MKNGIVIREETLLWAMLIMILPVFGACQKEGVSWDEPLKIQTRPPFRGEKACGQLNIDLSGLSEEQPYVVSKREEIGSFRSCFVENNEEINFDKEFLVGVRICSACGFLRKQEVTLHRNKLIYSIEIENSICTAITCESYFLLIPKEYLNYPIEMNITTI